MEIILSKKKIQLDQSQHEVFLYLTDLCKKINKSLKKNPIRIIIKSWFLDSKSIQNLYIYGKVGRGKSMLMKNFFDNISTPKKSYFHFNSFMQALHRELHKLRKLSLKKNQSLVFLATKNIVKQNKIICLDEMQVEDVADAMILQEVFSYFIQFNIAIITTSNLQPTCLYENGLQRGLFLKFINKILLPNFIVMNLDSKTDYRGEFLESKQHYFYPNNSTNKNTILDILLKKSGGSNLKSKEIEILGRKLLIKNSYDNIAIFDFAELCINSLGVADFLAICQNFVTIFLLNIPILKPEDRNEAKRLIWFIDEVYENKVELFILANSKPEEIYVQGIGANAFKRTTSRLNKISSNS
jgi:cell division protein ZapE